MSGLEVGAAVFGLVIGTIDIIHKSIEIYEAVKDKSGIPKALRKVSDKLPSVENLLKGAQAQYKEGKLNKIDKQTWDDAKPEIEQCKKLCQELQDLLLSAYPEAGSGKAGRVWKGTQTVFSGKSKSAEALFKEISEHLDTLAKQQIINNTALLEEIKTLVQELCPDATTKGTQDVHGDVQGDVIHTINGDKVGGDKFGGDKVAGNKDSHVHHHHSEIPREEILWPSFFKTSNYDEYKNLPPKRTHGTCEWFLKHDTFQTWKESNHDNLLWLSADPGCGKSVLSRALIDEKLVGQASVCHFFFKEDDKENEQNKGATAICALLNQVFHHRPELISKHVNAAYKQCGQALKTDFERLWQILISAAMDEAAGNMVCIIDALDECDPSDRTKMIARLEEFYTRDRKNSNRGSCLKFLVTSRPYDDIRCEFYNLLRTCPSILLDGAFESRAISDEIQLVMKTRLAEIAEREGWDSSMEVKLQDHMSKVPNRTYLWLHLVLDEVAKALVSTEAKLLEVIDTLPDTVDEAYKKILTRCEHKKEVRSLLHIIVAAQRPMTLAEIDIALEVDEVSTDVLSTRLSELCKRERSKTEVKMNRWIRKACGPFVTILHNRVYLIHETARAYLVRHFGSDVEPQEWRGSILLTEAHRRLLRTCMANISLEEVEQAQKNGIYGAETCVQELITKYQFLDYSATNWLSHLRQSRTHDRSLRSDAVSSQALDLCDLGNGRSSVWFAILSRGDSTFGAMRSMRKMQPVLYWTISFGLIHETYHAFHDALEGMDSVYNLCDAVTAAVKNEKVGKELLAILLSRDAKIRMPASLTQDVANNTQQGAEMLRLLLEKRNAEVKITTEVVEAAVGNSGQGAQLIRLLLEERKPEVEVTPKVLEVAARNSKQGVQLMDILLRECGAEVGITPGLLETVAYACREDTSLMSLLLMKRGARVKFTHRVTMAAVHNIEKGAELMSLLLTKLGAKVKITPELVKAAARNSQQGVELMKLLFKKREADVKITPEVVEAAAGNSGQGVELMDLLLSQFGAEVKITPEVVKAAARNYGQGAELMDLLLSQPGAEVKITPEVVKAAARNSQQGVELMKLLFKKREADVKITPEVVEAAAGNSGQGIELMDLLFDQPGAEVKITPEVLEAAASNRGQGVQLIRLLLDECDGKVEITPEVVEAAVFGGNPEVLTILLDNCEKAVRITQSMFEAAVNDYWHGRRLIKLLLEGRQGGTDMLRDRDDAIFDLHSMWEDVIRLLLSDHGADLRITQHMLEGWKKGGFDERTMSMMRLFERTHGAKLEITPEVLKAAARNSQQGVELMKLLLKKREADVKITPEVVEAAAGNSGQGTELMDLLLSQPGAEVKITPEVVKAAARNSQQGVELMKLLFKKREADVKITPEVVKAAAGNSGQGVELMDLLLSQPGAEVKITPEVVKAAARNSQQGVELMKLLFKKREADVKITPEVVEAAAGNSGQGVELMVLLLSQPGAELEITTEVLKAAVDNSRHSVRLMRLLLEESGAEVKITPEVVKAAAGNSGQGVELMDLLLSQPGAEVKITPEVLEAAASNREQGVQLIRLLLDECEGKVEITSKVVVTVAGNSEQGVQLMRLLFEYEIKLEITPEVVKAAARNSQQGVELMKLLLKKREADVKITPEVVEAAAGNSGQGIELMDLLFDQPGAEVKITPEVVEAAAGNSGQGIALMDLLLSQSGAEVKITPEVVKAAARNSRQGVKLMKLLSNKCEAEVDIMPGVFEAAADNHEQGIELMQALVTTLSFHGPLHILPQCEILSSTLCRYKFPKSTVWRYLHHG